MFTKKLIKMKPSWTISKKKLVRVTKNDTHICILLKKVTLEKSFLASLSIFCGTM